MKSIKFPSRVKFSSLDNTNDTLVAFIRHNDLGNYTIDFTTKFEMVRPSNMVAATMFAQRRLCKNPKQFKNAHDHWFLNVDGIDISIADLERKNVQFSKHTQKLITDDLNECTAPLRLNHRVKVKLRGKNTCVETKNNTLPMKETCDKRKRLSDSSMKTSKSIKTETNETTESLVIEDDEEEPFSWTTDSDDWTSENLQYFIGLNPTAAPKMLRIENETYPVVSRKKRIPIYECVFEHPVTSCEKKVWLSSSILMLFHEYRLMLDEFASSNDMVCD
jgi:hypothetical protein